MVDKLSNSIDMDIVGKYECVKDVEKLCSELLQQSDTDPRAALLNLAKKKCNVELLDRAMNCIKADTCTAGTTDAKLDQCAQFIFGDSMQTIGATADSLNAAKESAGSVLTYTFYKAGTLCKFDLGDLRSIFEQAKQYKAGRSAGSASSSDVLSQSFASLRMG